MFSGSSSFGSRIAVDVHEFSEHFVPAATAPKTVAQVLDIVAAERNPDHALIRTAANSFALFSGVPPSELSIDDVYDRRSDFRDHLVRRKYSRNTVRSYVDRIRMFLKEASKLGWSPVDRIRAPWKAVVDLASQRKCAGIAADMALIRRTPDDVTYSDLQSWVDQKVAKGRSLTNCTKHKQSFLHVLHDLGHLKDAPAYVTRQRRYGVKVADMPLGLRGDVEELVAWKRSKFSFGRPKGGQHRAVTSDQLSWSFGALYGFVRDVARTGDVGTVVDLVQQPYVEGWVEWSLNERQLKPQSVVQPLRLICAAMRQHPKYRALDLTWLVELKESVSPEPESVLKERKARCFLEYEVLEAIPGMLRAERDRFSESEATQRAMLMTRELMIRWLITLPWRQRNLRECRISGPRPNLFKGPLSPFSSIERFAWVEKEVRANPNAEFWQFHFSPEETKTGIEVESLLPSSLVAPLEEYLGLRPHLSRGRETANLLLTSRGEEWSMAGMTEVLSELTLRYGGRRVTPHRFRDIFAYTWLKHHPSDTLRLSKMLWHKNDHMVVSVYGKRFNESSAVCAVEEWLSDRQAITVQGGVQ